MKIQHPYIYLLLIAILLISSCRNPESPLLVATASNMGKAMGELADHYCGSEKGCIEVVMSSSGKLTSQIREGAPYGLLFSADTEYPQRLYADSLTRGIPVPYAVGTLVFWSRFPFPDDRSLNWMDSLEGKIAVAQPSLAPYGRAALQVIERKATGDNIEPVYGESVSQVNHFIFSKVTDYAITAGSARAESELNSLGHWIEIDSSLFEPVLQSAVIIRRGDSIHPHAEPFLDFVLSAQGQAILKKYGYISPRELR